MFAQDGVALFVPNLKGKCLVNERDARDQSAERKTTHV